jgi:hypothetical protein
MQTLPAPSRPTLTLVSDRAAPAVRLEASEPSALANLARVSRLMKEAGSKLQVSVSDTPVAAPMPDRWGVTPRARLMLPIAAAARQPGVDGFYPIRGLQGILSASLPQLNVVIVAVDSQADTAQLLKAASSAWDQRSPNPSIGVVAEAAPPVEQAAALARLWPEASFAHYCATEALALFASRADAFDILLVPTSVAALFASAGAALSGTRRCAARVVCTEDAVYFEDISESTDQDPDSADPSGLLLAAAGLMRRAGEFSAAERLENALLRTLEDGLHTRALTHLSPYSKCLTPAAFADAVAARIGQRPRRLAPAQSGETGARPRAVLAICR